MSLWWEFIYRVSIQNIGMHLGKKKKKEKIISIENNFFYLAEIQTLLKAFDKKIWSLML